MIRSHIAGRALRRGPAGVVARHGSGHIGLSTGWDNAESWHGASVGARDNRAVDVGA